MNGEVHQMKLRKKYQDGSELWTCPECGHKIMLTWPPNYSKKTLEQGDVEAMHSVSKGSLLVSIARVEQQDPRLGPFEEFLKREE